jgi:CRP/FNR family transcriptional regulator, cyclic AMP receptor protein
MTGTLPASARYEGVVRALVLEHDADLSETVPEAERYAAVQASVAALLEVPVGQWDARIDADRARPGFGLLVLDGVLIRRVGSSGRYGAELLAAGDLLRPWEFDGDDTLGFESTWRVLAATRMAVLDTGWAARMARYTRIGPELAGRALRRSRRLAAMMAIAQQPRLEERLLMIFWELADRHGRVRSDGVHVDLPLTHELLSHLAAARRPSVSGALSRLADQGRLRRERHAWVLSREP